MAVIVAADTNTILDSCCKFSTKLTGDSGSGMGAGTTGAAWGASGAVQDIKTCLLAMTDLDPLQALIKATQDLITQTDGPTLAGPMLASLLIALQGHVGRYSLPGPVRSIDDFLTYLNTATGTKWQTLQSPTWATVAYKALGSTPSVWNLYFEVLQGSTYANALRKKVVGGAETAGFSIDTALYAGGFPQLRVSGLTGTGTVTITGTAYDPATKATSASKTWTASVSGNGVVALAPGGGSPAPTDSLIVAASAFTIPGGISAGTIYVEAARPTGRPLV